jgi:hypothetical protein
MNYCLSASVSQSEQSNPIAVEGSQRPARKKAGDGHLARAPMAMRRDLNIARGHSHHRSLGIPPLMGEGKMASDPREVELKLQLQPGSRAILEGSKAFANATAKHHHEVTTYFDTPDSALSRAGFVLRVRRSGGLHIQTVKSRANRRGLQRAAASGSGQ